MLSDIKGNITDKIRYEGLTSILQRIVTAYEDYLGLPLEFRTDIRTITLHGDNKIIVGNNDDRYAIEGYILTAITEQQDCCMLIGYKAKGSFSYNTNDIGAIRCIDISSFVDNSFIDIEWLIDRIKKL